MKLIFQIGLVTLISNFDELNNIFHADKWLEENFGCEFYPSYSGYLNTSCPFEDHNDSSPSFGINLEKGFFKCFGCSREGSFITLVAQLLNINAYQALNIIAHYEGLNLDNIDSFTLKNEKFKKALIEDDKKENKKEKVIQKAILKIKRIMKKDFNEADKLYKQLDCYIKEDRIVEISEMTNGRI